MTDFQRADGVTNSTAGVQPARGGVIPASALHFLTGQVEAAQQLVMQFHYSRRIPSNVRVVGSLHFDGGLFGGQGECVAAAFFSIPPTRWAEPVLELSRLVRRDGEQPPLTLLISLSLRAVRAAGGDLVVSFADRQQGHEGIVYRAASWHYAGIRANAMDGVMVNGTFHPGRSCNSIFGTRSPDKLRTMFPHKTIEPHYDAGKHLYWKALGPRGMAKAARLGLKQP